jgi:3-deoxy-D-manno-octulosonic-acid transferase
MLLRVTHFFVQNQLSLELLYKKGITEVTVTGDTRFDRVFELSQNTNDLPNIESFRGNKQLFVAGSTWPADENLIFQLVNHFSDQFRFIIAPHEINENNIVAIEKKLSGKTIRYSLYTKVDSPVNVLILDNVGMLASVYKYAAFVYVGGGFGKGIHNILEAAVYGSPVFFGPNYKKFTEAKDLLRWKGAFAVKNGNELVNYVQELLNDPKKLQRIFEINTNYVKNNKGATDLIINYLKLNYSYS